MKKNTHGYSSGGAAWIMPSLIAMAVIQFAPGIISILMGFTNLGVTNINNIASVQSVGLDNFARIFTPGTAEGNHFLNSLVGTLLYTFFSTFFGYLLALGLALLLNVPFKGRAIVRSLMIVPWIVPNVVAAFIWRLMYMSDYGIINKILRGLGLIEENIFFLLNEMALPSLIVAHIWSALPFMMISILAGLQTIPGELYEACKIDGGNVFQRFRHITMPGISTISAMVVLLSFIRGTGEFTLPFVMYGRSTPSGMADLLSVLIYRTSFTAWEFGRGAAMSTVILLVMMVFAVFYMRATMKKERG